MNKKLMGCAIVLSGLLSGCLNNLSTEQMVEMGLKGFQALSLSDAQVKTLSDDSCQSMDQQNSVARSGSSYEKRLNKIVAGLPKTVNGQPANYKVYMVNDVNAWAMANGCIRVYSGLMDLMTDDEVQGVLGHEVGHVSLGHTKEAMRLAMIASLGRDALIGQGNSTVATLSRSQLGDFTEKFINAQFSQSQETAADDYAFKMLKNAKKDPLALATAFEKLAKKGSTGGILSSHPAAQARADRVRSRLASESKPQK